MFAEDDYIPISALQHYSFCPRQCALIHLEMLWADNMLTAEGNLLHQKAHEGKSELKAGVRIVRGLRLASSKLGLTGIADVVEFISDGEGGEVPGLRGRWRPFPVEYKRGEPKEGNCDRVQLCAQALCLEEMLGIPVLEGALFYGEPRRREHVEFDELLRSITVDLVESVRALFVSRRTPAAVYNKRCRSCSLLDYCQPKSAGTGKSVARYLGQILSADEEAA